MKSDWSEADPERVSAPLSLTALTLLIAEGAPANKDLLVRLIVNLLAGPEG